MSTRTGFPRMDWDTGFLADPKFQHLRDLASDPITFGYAGFCYLRVVADAWRTCERRPVTTIIRGIDSGAVLNLNEAGLLEDGYLPQESFDKWIGSGLSEREKSRDRQRSHRESRDVTVTNSAPRIGRTGSDGRTGGSRGEGIFDRMMERRRAHFQETGQWDPEWGPAPEAGS